MTDWAPGETARYAPCARHASALGRMDFDIAFTYAAACEDEGGNCTTAVRPEETA